MLTVNTKYKEWVKVKHNYSYIVVFDFYPLFILCINTQRGCHTLKLPTKLAQVVLLVSSILKTRVSNLSQPTECPDRKYCEILG